MKIKTYIKNIVSLEDPMYRNLKTKHWLNAFLKLLPKNASILEIGSGTGRIADYIEERNFKVKRTDKFQDFVKYQKNLGKDVGVLDIKKKVTRKSIAHGIVANCVFNLFSISGILNSFENINDLLKDRGYFAFNVTAEWDRNDIEYVCFAVGFNIIDIFKDSVWYHVICQKQKTP